MSTTLSNSATSLTSGTAGLMINGSGSNQTTNNTSAQVPANTLYNLSRGMKENFFIAAINQINQTANVSSKQAIMNGLQNQSQLTNSLVQQFNQTNQTNPPIQASSQPQSQPIHQRINEQTNPANSINNNCQQFYQQQTTHHQQLTNALRLKNLNMLNANTAATLINGGQVSNQTAVYRALSGVNTLSCKQQAATNHQLINNLNQQGVNQTVSNQTNSTSNTGSILLNISNHNNHTNSHFNHYNQHQATNQNGGANFYNGFPLNYNLQQTAQTPYYHSNSLSSSPRSSTSSSSSLINYNQLQNGLAKYQQQTSQHSPTSSVASSPNVVNAPPNQLTSQSPTNNKQLTNGHAKIATTNKTNQTIQSATQINNSSNNSNSNTAAAQNGSRYKTELCRPFEESGFCKYSDKCQYAHGLSELRTLQRHPKYKTSLCRTYHTTGFCGYGRRCHFIHESNVSSANTTSSAQSNGTATNNASSLLDSFSSGSNTPNNVASAVAILNGTISNSGQTTPSASLNSNKSSIDSIEINTNASASSGVSSMANSVGSASSASNSPSPQQSIFSTQQSQLKKSNSKLHDLLPLSPGLSSLSSKSDEVFYKYL